jgi:D-alanyl-lipoteichoic acid acyltransferase DltB (MBOAT superfamily)
MFYPQLVAGPIERPQHLLPQLFEKQRFSYFNLYAGLRLMAWGFFKKLVIADRIGIFADAVFNAPADAGYLQIWLAVFFFSIQIYADFSGYSDIAIGAARCMGIDLSINFNRPYLSRNIREFWQRWHISLSSWFRDYVYIPLGGNRRGPFRRNLNLLITFLLSAMWHGAGWTFLAWGLLHALYTLIFDTAKLKPVFQKLPWLASYIITGICVGFAWIFFRAPTLENALAVTRQSLFGKTVSWMHITSLPSLRVPFGNFTMLFSFCMIGLMFLVERYTSPKLSSLNKNPISDMCVFVGSVLLVIFFGMFEKSSFIYFQF